MKLSFRDLGKDVIIYGLGDIVLKATAFFTLPIYTRLFSPEDYGILSTILTTVGLIFTVVSLGAESTYTRYYFEAKTQRDRQVVTSTWFGFLAIWTGGWMILCLGMAGIFSEWLLSTSRHGVLFALVIVSGPISLVNSLCAQVLRNQFRPQLFVVLNVFSGLLGTGLGIVGAAVLKLGLVGVVGGGLVGAVAMLPVRIWTVRQLLRPVFSPKLLRGLLAFGIPLVPAALAYWIIAVSDRMLLAKLSTLEQVGLYAIANSVASLLLLVNGAIGQAWSPYVLRMYEEDRASVNHLCARTMTYLLVGFGTLCVGITAFAHEALVLLATPPFYGAAMAVGPLALGVLAYATTHVTALGFSLNKKTEYLALYTWLASFLNVGLNFLLIPRWGMMATSWTTAAAYGFVTVAYLITSQRLWPIAYERRKGLTALLLTVFFMLIVPNGANGSFLVKSAFFLTYIALLVIFRVLDGRELVGVRQIAHLVWGGRPVRAL